jgi:hypothetical protein
MSYGLRVMNYESRKIKNLRFFLFFEDPRKTTKLQISVFRDYEL